MSHSITIKRDRTWKRRFFIQDENGAAVNLTGLTIKFQIKRKDEDADPALVDKFVGNGITLDDQLIVGQTDAGRGWGLLVVTPADTPIATTPPGAYRAELYASDGVDKFSAFGPMDCFITGVVVL